jgi:uncharacterized protein (TIRG00374 family)
MVHLLKLGISAFLICYLLFTLDFQNILFSVSKISFLYLLLAILSYAVITLIHAVRWSELIRMCGMSISYWFALRITTIGLFFSNYIPASGGDFVKGVYTSKYTEVSLSQCIYCVIVEKSAGFVSLFLVLIAAASFTESTLITEMYFLLHFFGRNIWASELWPKLLAVLFIVFVVCLLAFRKSKALPSWLTSLLNLRVRWNLRSFLVIAQVSLLAQLLQAGMYFFLCLAIGIELDVFTIVFLSQIISLVIYLPVSFGGWGVREGLLLGLSTTLMQSDSDLFVLGILAGFVPVIVSIPGFIIWQFWPGTMTSQSQKVD